MPDSSHLKGARALNLWDDPLVDCYDMVAYLPDLTSRGLAREFRKDMLTTKQYIYWKNHYEKKGYKVRYSQSTFGEGNYE